MKKNLKFIIIGVVIVLIIVLGYFLIFKKTDSEKFEKEYGIDENVFVYKNSKEIIDILENGTGIVYLGFSDCKWCTAYVKILNEVALEEELKEIYYYDIEKDRDNNTKTYKEIISIIGENLLFDSSGTRKIFVPDVTFVLDGEIIGHDNETSTIDDDITPEEYWTEENIKALKEKLRFLINVVK